MHYTVLRRRDRRELQNDLMDLGVTSLATVQANVQAKVRAARNVLCALRGDPGPWELGAGSWELEAIIRALHHGDEILRGNAKAVFGPAQLRRPTRIMVTPPGEAAVDPRVPAGYVDSGMDIARINGSHDDVAAWAAMAANVRSASHMGARPVLVSVDLPGPKLRTGPILDGPAVGRARVTRLASGDVLAPARIWFTHAFDPAPPPPIPGSTQRPALSVHVDLPWLVARAVGDVVTMRDHRGPRRSLVVTRCDPRGVLAEGAQNTYVREGADLWCEGAKATAEGISPHSRAPCR